MCLGGIAASVIWPGEEVAIKSVRAALVGHAVGYILAGIIGGFCLIGFGVLIGICDEIRGRSELAQGNQNAFGGTVGSDELSKQIKDYRLDNRLSSEAEAIHQLIELGLEAAKRTK